VSLAARLEAANKPFGTAIMLSEFTHAQVKDHFETRYLDCIQVPGKARPIKTYELLCEKDQLTPERRQALERYDEGMKLFHARKFTEAHERFLMAAALFGQDDKACAVYIERSRAFRQEPPPADWDGVFQVTTP
jgi:adenylate cyclase